MTYLGMALDHTVLADIHAMLVAKLVRNITFWTLAEAHGAMLERAYVLISKVRLGSQNLKLKWG